MRKNVADLHRQILRHHHNAVAGPCAHGPGEIGDAQIISVQDLTGHVLVCARGRPPLCRLRNVQTELSKLKSAAQVRDPSASQDKVLSDGQQRPVATAPPRRLKLRS